MDQFKKLANSVFGKTMQNVRDYVSVKLHTSEKTLLKAISNVTFKSYTIIGEDLVQTNHFTPTITHDKPIAIGFTILELSKHIMFDFWYNKMTKNSPCEFNLGMSDTDSFLFEVTKPKLFWKSVEPYMDFSNYDKDHPKFSEGNKAKLGFFKDELCGGKKCVEFIGLRPKCYALNLVDKKSNVE
ncbi:hypothetical protein DAPPUDRAFT_344893, partial [Daphnia pulex]